MACVIKQNVLRLQVSVNDVEAVQTLECAQKFSCVESRSVDIESLLLLQVVEQFSSIDKCEDKVKLLRRLEGELERYDERIVDLGEDRTFGERVSDF